MLEKICLECLKVFWVYPYREKAKYCSSKCYQKNWKNYIYGVKIKKGQHLSHKTEFKKGHPGRKGVDNHNWLGDKVGYMSIHKWVRDNKGTSKKCEFCKKIVLNSRGIDWANKDHKYKRNLEDYIRLCRLCHRRYDKKFNQ